ncbi:hypothetical protein V8V91_03530 [Algoriphagus halophilus]|uniref:YtxH-like protein n=1 Tax=Algoriphagus halophilus TaxID=226505 RepID=A0A1N6E4X2_9BACT|nr:hypothetical protein [Algoriphagus halophilus]SIN78023.1 hypothetical protein SAMN05444394_1716 [Algoriphagus halophilus]
MNKQLKTTTIWVGGLITGAMIGAFLYKNKDQYEPQKEKLNSLLSDFQNIATDLKSKLLSASQEGLNATKSALQTAKETAKETAKNAKEKVK